MRTTVTIDDDVLAVARALAEQKRTSLGSALSDLARRGFRSVVPPGDPGDGSLFPVSEDAGPIASEDVHRSLDDWPSHVHHAAARAWFDDRRDRGWATCPITEPGFVRISCNPQVVRHHMTPLDAIAVLGALARLGSHSFWPVDRSIVRLPEAIRDRLRGYRQITDAVLLATAMHRDGQLATLDSALDRLFPARERRFLSVIPV